MSQEIQLTPAADYWTQGQSAMGPAAMPPKMSPLKRVHRLLRGRYPLAIFLAAATAVTGAIAGYVALQPKFESDGLVNINPMITRPGDDQVVPMIGMYLASQTALIQSTGVAEEALNNKDFGDAWAKAYPTAGPMAAADFLNAVDAERAKNGTVIKVSFTDKDKDVAQAGARATVAAYMKLHGNGDDAERQKKLAFLYNQQTKLNSTLSLERQTLSALATKYGTADLAIMNQAVQEELARLESELTQATLARDAAASAQAGASANAKPADPEFLIQQIAAVDPTMRNLVLQRDKAQLDVQSWKKIYGTNHPTFKRYEENATNTAQLAQNYARDFLARNQGRVPLALDGENNTANLKILQTRTASLQKLVEIQRGKAIDIGTQRSHIEEVLGEITHTQQELNGANQRIDSLLAEQKLAQNVTVVDPGSEAIIASDKRKIAAVVGFVFGGLLPIGLMLMYGMADHRVRYSDETDEADLAGVTLLGILPNLPDRLSDPQQAGVAAHCVHQIRTMLQINRNNDEPQVLAITSAAAGDGKTSLTLALGLSYAACGARTLLIDCDLVAAGLTHRLNVNSLEGVLEAVANRALLEFVRTTDIADVAILPVGTGHAFHASTLSPVALRRLLSEAKKNFDIILIDTGPILGSIEASLVCAAADRTILTVARGQQRLLVERSIGHLQAIGTDVAGVVFNRAQARDFENSVSGLALRSRSVNGNGVAHSAGADAVSGSFKRAG
jgi:capsular exopolysaccharide synthesis family protein